MFLMSMLFSFINVNITSTNQGKLKFENSNQPMKINQGSKKI